MNIQSLVSKVQTLNLQKVILQTKTFWSKIKNKEPEEVYLTVNIIRAIGGAFTGTAYGLTLLGGGLNLFTMMLPNVIFFSMNSFLEISTGIFADRYSLKVSVRLGLLFWALGMFFYGIAGHIPTISPLIGFIIGEMTAALGSAFISGAFFALVKKTSNKSEKEIRNIEAKARAYGGYAGLIASAFSGVAIVILGVSSVWFVSSILSLFALAVFEKYMPDAFRKNEKSEDQLNSWHTLTVAIGYFRENKNSRYILFGNAMLEFCFQPLNMYWSLIFRDLFGEIITGIIWSASTFLYAFGSDKTRHEKREINSHYMMLAAFKISLLIMLGMIIGNLGITVSIALGFILHEFWRGQLRSIMNARIVSTSDPLIHATVMSAGETLMHYSRIAGLLTFGLFALRFGILTTWLLSGTLMLISVIFFFFSGE